MKKNLCFIAIFAMSALLFSACISEDDNDENPPVTGNTPGNNFVYEVGTTLLQTQWGRGNQFPYNMMTPRDDNGTPTFAGCVAIATAQIMGYHKHPARGSGYSEPYLSSKLNKQMPSVDLNVAYDWNNMLNTYRGDGSDSNQRQQNAIATLMYHVGVSVKMDYGIGGAMGGSGSSGRRAATALVNHFGYDKSIQRHRRIDYDAAGWVELIKAQIDAGLPVFHSSDGHARNLDGYDDAGRFHINNGMGINNRNNLRWVYIDGIQPEEDGAVDDDEEGTAVNTASVMINIMPDKGSIGSNEMVLTTFTVNNTSITQNEQLTVTARIRSSGIFPGGQRGVALVDNNSEIAEIIGIGSFNSLSLESSRTLTINTFIPETVQPKQYNLRIVTRMADEQEWKIITVSEIGNNIPSSIPIIVIEGTGTLGGGYGLSLTEFSTDKTTVGRNETFAVTVNHRNRGEGQFPGGTIGVVLVDNDGYIIGEPLATRTRGALTNSWVSPLIINCTIPYYGIDPDNYRLRIAVKVGDGDWRISSIAEGDVPTAIDFTVTEGVRNPFLDFFYSVAAYRNAAGNTEVVVNENLTIDQLVSIPAPALAGATLTIRSANASQIVTLTRGVSGNLFTVANGVTLIFCDIIIDGASGGAFADNSGGSLVRLNGGSFTMNAGTVLRNNTNTTTATATLGGGVNANTNSTFTMNGGMISGNIAGGNGGGLIVTNSAVSTMSGGEISGNEGTTGGGVRISAKGVFTLVNGKISNNTARSDGGGVSVADTGSTFNINGGEISGNTASTVGGGVSVTSSAVSTMTGGEISGNRGTDGGGVRASGSGVFTLANGKIINNTATSGVGSGISSASSAGSIFNLSGGVVAGTGTAITNVVSGTHNLNTSEGAPNNAVVFAWNRASGTLNYTVGTNTDLTVSAGAAATWANQSGALGISYSNGSNTGWIKQW